MEKRISVLIVNFNSADFIGLSLRSLEKLTKSEYDVFIIDNGSKLNDYLKLKKICSKYSNTFLERWETDLRGSVAHGTALNYLANKVKTPFFSILDADATWLIKNWDEILIEKINDSVKVIGTQAPEPKPQDFPLMFAIFFETKTFKSLNIDFRPKDFKVMQDTGFEMREKYLKAGFVGKNIQMRNTRKYKNGPFGGLLVAEFYLDKNKNIFASHFGRGSSLGKAKYGKYGLLKFICLIPFFGGFLKRFQGGREKKKWINICDSIIKNQ